MAPVSMILSDLCDDDDGDKEKKTTIVNFKNHNY